MQSEAKYENSTKLDYSEILMKEVRASIEGLSLPQAAEEFAVNEGAIVTENGYILAKEINPIRSFSVKLKEFKIGQGFYPMQADMGKFRAMRGEIIRAFGEFWQVRELTQLTGGDKNPTQDDYQTTAAENAFRKGLRGCDSITGRINLAKDFFSKELNESAEKKKEAGSPLTLEKAADLANSFASSISTGFSSITSSWNNFAASATKKPSAKKEEEKPKEDEKEKRASQIGSLMGELETTGDAVEAMMDEIREIAECVELFRQVSNFYQPAIEDAEKAEAEEARKKKQEALLKAKTESGKKEKQSETQPREQKSHSSFNGTNNFFPTPTPSATPVQERSYATNEVKDVWDKTTLQKSLAKFTPPTDASFSKRTEEVLDQLQKLLETRDQVINRLQPSGVAKSAATDIARAELESLLITSAIYRIQNTITLAGPTETAQVKKDICAEINKLVQRPNKTENIRSFGAAQENSALEFLTRYQQEGGSPKQGPKNATVMQVAGALGF